MKNLARSLLLASVFVAGCASGPDPLLERPNVIVIMTDDQGLGDLSCMGNSVLETPNIDRLAAESARLTQFYVSPVCTPTRAALMTGRYPQRTRAIDTYLGRAMMDPGEATIAELLRGAGYRTGIFGKWHLGDCYPMRAMDQGFDSTLVHRGGGLAQPSEPRENSRRYTDAILFRNGEQVRTEGYCTDVYFDAAIEMLEQAGSQPCFVYLPTNAPHTPLHDVPQRLYDKYRVKDLSAVLPEGATKKQADAIARVFAMIENIDQNVGRLLAALERTGKADNTIVVYLHDNGPQQRRFCCGLRGTKASVYEGGIRSPLFVRWPGCLAPGERSAGFGAHIDVAPTLYDLLGIEIPDALRLDGRSLAPLLHGVETPEHRSIVLQAHRGDAACRGHHVAVRGPRYKLVRASGFGREQPKPDTPWELYDLQSDPGESADLAAQHPELVTSMRAFYDAWFDDVSATRPDNYAPPRIVVGSSRAREVVLTRQDWRSLGKRGWGWDGHWLLSFAGEHRYDVRLITMRPLANVRAELTIGDVRRELRADGPSDSFVFEDVAVPVGNAALRAVLDHGEGGNKRTGPYQVVITRR
ncbi:MAG: arylsulfatase [bacterium]|nr:arylsulfatase [bacterium]